MTRIVNNTKPECEEAFLEAYEEWETKWADVPESENEAAQAKAWVKSFEEEYSIGRVCLLRRKRLMLGQHARPTNWLGETLDMSKTCSDLTLLSWIRSLTKKAGQLWALSWNNDGQVQGQPDSEGQTNQLAKPPIHPPGYTEACSSSTSHLVEEEIHQLTNRYWDCAYKASKIYDDRPPLTRMVDRILLLVEHHDRHGRSYAWIFQRATCADTGGCCGRSCGCCEQPLITYLRPVSDTDLEKQEDGFDGRCEPTRRPARAPAFGSREYPGPQPLGADKRTLPTVIGFPGAWRTLTWLPWQGEVF
ncbi:hypothetical protein P168DRAFT_323978 [Aspergillus campestris IBT 28561]|uniref:Uncharacterized protein n=1 Tax=Aspergillus campestris (strain IBT 28561) TaxID=1392248 RepID=A0A2I1DGD9_ASPC2|nr:uncharacterized protein P168DRAFT_323978 [Aspergillus campestris IBT 28561]PKY08936.1 hypothetical protein P168DRAFT_323978 [Aspergillus campestris IBT 28561]